jgi:hypothetical protein
LVVRLLDNPLDSLQPLLLQALADISSTTTTTATATSSSSSSCLLLCTHHQVIQLHVIRCLVPL